MSARFIEPVTLEGRVARLVPLEHGHTSALAAVARDGRLWELFFTTVPAPEETSAYVERALDLREHRHEMPFAVIERVSSEIVGTTRYMSVEPAHLRVEIGSTWYAERVQRTALNTECKLLLLRHAFEQLGCNVVELRTNWFNHRSQRAIERLGAHRDGVLRSNQIMRDGRVRDTVVYSILAHEWDGVRRNLEHKLARGGPPPPR